MINWPSAPTASDIYTSPNGTTWVYSGYAWETPIQYGATGLPGTGSTGPTGPSFTGPTGPTGPPGIDSLTHSNVSFVDPLYGNNTSARINDEIHPFLSVNIAGASMSGTATSTQPALIYLRAGNYTEMIDIYTNVFYYCEPGVVFLGGGFRDLVSTSKVCRIYGYLRYDYNLGNVLTIESNANIYFEFDEILDCDTFIRAYQSSVGLVKGNAVRSNGSTTGICSTFRDSCQWSIRLTNKAQGENNLWNISGGTSSGVFSGKVSITCPLSESIDDYSGLGNSLLYKQTLRVEDLSNSSEVTHIGDITNSGSDFVNLSDWAGLYIKNIYATSSKIKVVGKISSIYNAGITYFDSVNSGSLEVIGNISSGSYHPIYATGVGTTGSFRSLIKNSTITGLPSFIGETQKFSFDNCKIRETLTIGGTNIAPLILGSYSTTNFYNCLIYGDGTTPLIAEGVGNAGVVTGFITTTSNIPLTGGTDSMGGLAINVNLILP